MGADGLVPQPKGMASRDDKAPVPHGMSSSLKGPEPLASPLCGADSYDAGMIAVCRSQDRARPICSTKLHQPFGGPKEPPGGYTQRRYGVVVYE
jgi:hypothetical protein